MNDTQIIDVAPLKLPSERLARVDEVHSGAHPDVREMMKSRIQHEYDTRHVMLLDAVMKMETAHDRHDEINLNHLEQMRDRLSRILDSRSGKL